MSKSRGNALVQLSLLSAVILAVGSCVSSGPVFHGELLTPNCDKPAGDHTISVNDLGGVSPADECVVIKRTATGGNYIQWASTSNKMISIAFILAKNQAVPFQKMSCGLPDPQGNRLCVLIDCSTSCKTEFLSSYQPVSPNSSPLNYYYYSPGVTSTAGVTTQGADPGIRIER